MTEWLALTCCNLLAARCPLSSLARTDQPRPNPHIHVQSLAHLLNPLPPFFVPTTHRQLNERKEIQRIFNCRDGQLCPPCSCAFPDRRILITTFLTMIHQARTDKKVSTDKNWGCLLVFRGFWGKKNWVFWVQRMIEDEGRWELQRKDWRMISSGGFIGFSGFGEDRQIIATSNKTGDSNERTIQTKGYGRGRISAVGSST